MRLRLNAIGERVRASLFFVPMVGVVVAILAGLAALELDQRLEEETRDLPLGLTSTVGSARVVLSTIAGATITFAGIAFSISLLVIQLASSQYSPRVVHTLFRDPFNKRVMGLVVGTFTYCLIVLRSVRSALEEGGEPVIPNVAVAIAVLLGVSAILATVAFINHSAHSMDVSEILEDVTRDTIGRIRNEWSEAEPGSAAPGASPEDMDGAHLVRFERTGWVQQIDAEALLALLPERGVMQLETYPGRYAVQGTPLCAVSPEPDDVEEFARAVRAALTIGETRTMQQDPSYGLRQLADVALKALSPGVNDPTTAQDAIFHCAAVLGEFLRRDPPPVERSTRDGARLLLPQQHTHAELVGLAFDETRRAAASQPTVCVYLLEAISLLTDALEAAGLDDRIDALHDQARLVVEGCESAGLVARDLEVVRSAHEKRFGPARV